MQVGKKKAPAHLLSLQYIQRLPISRRSPHSHDLIATSTLARVSSVSAACILALPASSAVRCRVVQGGKVVQRHIPRHSVPILYTGTHLVRYVWQLSECSFLFLIFHILIYTLGARVSVVVKALCYKPEGRGFDTQWGEFLNLPNPSGRTRPWGLLSLWQEWVPET
jgi:hypothetical protein